MNGKKATCAMLVMSSDGEKEIAENAQALCANIEKALGDADGKMNWDEAFGGSEVIVVLCEVSVPVIVVRAHGEGIRNCIFEIAKQCFAELRPQARKEADAGTKFGVVTYAKNDGSFVWTVVNNDEAFNMFSITIIGHKA